MEKFKRTALLNGLGIVGVLCGAGVLIAMGILSPASLVFALIACCPMTKVLYHYFMVERQNTIRILDKALPKMGFVVSNTEWDDKKIVLRYYGSFLGDNFLIEAAKECGYIMIYDMPWHGVKVSDPIVPTLMEAVNDVNASSSNMSVIVCDPDEKGIRQIYTLCKTILPEYGADRYLNSLLREMLNCKPALGEAMRKDRSYMQQRRGPVGFTAQQPKEPEEETTMAPAAHNDTEVKD